MNAGVPFGIWSPLSPVPLAFTDTRSKDLFLRDTAHLKVGRCSCCIRFAIYVDIKFDEFWKPLQLTFSRFLEGSVYIARKRKLVVISHSHFLSYIIQFIPDLFIVNYTQIYNSSTRWSPLNPVSYSMINTIL